VFGEKRDCHKFSKRICWQPFCSALRSYKILLGGKLLTASRVCLGWGCRAHPGCRGGLLPPLTAPAFPALLHGPPAPACPAHCCPATARANLIAEQCQGRTTGTNQAARPRLTSHALLWVPEHAELRGLGARAIPRRPTRMPLPVPCRAQST